MRCPSCGRFMTNNTPYGEKHIDEWFCTNPTCSSYPSIISNMEAQTIANNIQKTIKCSAVCFKELVDALSKFTFDEIKFWNEWWKIRNKENKK